MISDAGSSTATHISEGLSAYAREQRDAEKQRGIAWAAQWSAVRAHASSVLSGHLTCPLPRLEVEITDDEDECEEEDEDDGV